MNINTKYQLLKEKILKLENVVVAFSGGIDSTFLAWAGNEFLGENSLAVTIKSPLFPEMELNDAISLAKRFGFSHHIIDVGEQHPNAIFYNPPERCFICKRFLFRRVISFAGEHNVDAVLEGSNKDDEHEYRPGKKALRELGIISPLQEAGFTKQEIRELSRDFGLPNWNKPAFTCLATRLPYGSGLDTEKLSRLNEAEMLLKSMGFSQFRVRWHGDMARIEIDPKELSEICKEPNRTKINNHFKNMGFKFVTVDLQGYRTGSMDD